MIRISIYLMVWSAQCFCFFFYQCRRFIFFWKLLLVFQICGPTVGPCWGEGWMWRGPLAVSCGWCPALFSGLLFPHGRPSRHPVHLPVAPRRFQHQCPFFLLRPQRNGVQERVARAGWGAVVQQPVLVLDLVRTVFSYYLMCKLPVTGSV